VILGESETDVQDHCSPDNRVDLIGIASLTAKLGIRPMAAFVGKAHWLS